MMVAGDYSDVQSALKTDLGAARLLANAAEQAGMSKIFPTALLDLMQDAVARGYGELDSAAMVEALWRTRAPVLPDSSMS